MAAAIEAHRIERRTKWKSCAGLVAGLFVLAFAAGSGRFLVAEPSAQIRCHRSSRRRNVPTPSARFRVAQQRIRVEVDPRCPCRFQNLPVDTTGTSGEIYPGSAGKQIDHYLRNSRPLNEGRGW